MNNLTTWYEIGGIVVAVLAGIATGFYYLVNKGKIGMLLKERKAIKKPIATQIEQQIEQQFGQ